MARKSRKAENMAVTPPEPTIITYNTAIYLRLSVMDSGKKDGESILNQQAFLERYVSEHPEFTLRKVFIDNGETGVDFVRPAWNDLMAECRAGRINLIVVKDLSRVGRNYIETGELLEKIFPLLGVRMIAVTDGYDNLHITNNQQLVANLKNLVNDIYAKDISRKSSAALRMKQKQGLFIGTYASYGYLKDPNDKNKIIVDPVTAPIVRQIFEWKAEGVGSAQICRRLIEMGISSPNKYRYEQGIVKDERYLKSDWANPVLTRILTCEVYLGHLVQGRKHGALFEDGGSHKVIDESEWTIVRDTHEPIVSQELFDRANTVMRERTAEYKSRQGKYSYFEKPPLLLKDLVFCADCGRPLFRYKEVTANGKYVHWKYQCRTFENLRTCSKKFIEECDLYGAVYDAIRAEVQKACDISGIIAKLNRESSHKSRLARFDAEIEETEREIKRIAGLRQSVYEDYASKLLTASEYQFAVEKYNADTERLKERLETAKREKTEYTASSTTTNKWLVAFTRFMDAKEFSADMANALIERVEVSDYNKVTVTFKFRDELAAIQQYAEVAA
jgi:DNA invertase Pin-like site-specific DNA recombinase